MISSKKGIQGNTGSQGSAGVNAYTTTTQVFNQPANQSSVTIGVTASSMFVTGEILVMASGGYYQATIVNSTAIILLNLGYPGNAVAGTSIPIGTLSAGGLQGPQGPQGNNLIKII